METNKRIYYVLMAIAALVVVLTALSCIVITDGSLLYTLAIAIPVAVVLAVVAVMYTMLILPVRFRLTTSTTMLLQQK